MLNRRGDSGTASYICSYKRSDQSTQNSGSKDIERGNKFIEGLSLALSSPFFCIHPFVALHTCYYRSRAGFFLP